jgi:Ca2+-binding RTX toxin-like protein
VSYGDLAVAVRVDLSRHVATGAGMDRLHSVRHAVGSVWRDTLIGSAESNRLQGYRGRDLIRGRAGADVLLGGGDEDRLRGGVATTG